MHHEKRSGHHMEKLGTLDSGEKTIAIPRRRMVATDDQRGRGQDNGDFSSVSVIYGRSASSTQMLESSVLGVGTVLRLERDA